MATSTRITHASKIVGSHTRQKTRGPVLGGISGEPISCVGRGSPGRSCRSTSLVLPSHGACARLAIMSRATSDTTPQRRCFIAGSFGASPSCESGATGSLRAVTEETRRLRADGKGSPAQSRGVVSVRTEGGAAMTLPIQTAGQCNDIQARTRVRNRQASSCPSRQPGRDRWVTWPSNLRAYQRRRPARAGLASSRGLPNSIERPYFPSGFLNSSSASVGFSVRLVTLASITGLSSISVFSLCGNWTLPTGFQSP
jgi:hypothetical protein